jgi:two-component system, OmpR family, KDP operon response regulator KdpE
MMDKTKILVVDDELQIRRFLRASLPPPEHELIEAETGAEAIRHVASHNPDVVLLDLGLPDMDGIEVVKNLREWTRVPVIVLSARGQEKDKIDALDAGADDYLTKPFSLGELQARIRVALRNRALASGLDSRATFSAGALEIDYSSRVVRIAGNEIHLTPIEYKLLTTLARNAGRVLTHNQLLTEVWGAAYANQSQYLRVFMGQLRHKIEKDPARPELLTTEAGVGYRFRVPE